MVGARRLEVQSGQGLQVGAALRRQRGLVAEPEIAAAFELPRPTLGFSATDLVDGVATTSPTATGFAPGNTATPRCVKSSVRPER